MSNPPTEINYLVRLHRESLKREQELLAVRVYHDHLISATRAAFDAEVKSIEEEFTNARTQAKEKLLESLEERRKKLKDEKELVDFNEEAVGHSHRTHTTRGLRNRSSNRIGFPRGSPSLGYSGCHTCCHGYCHGDCRGQLAAANQLEWKSETSLQPLSSRDCVLTKSWTHNLNLNQQLWIQIFSNCPG